MKIYNSHVTIERKKNEEFDVFMQRFKKKTRDSRIFLDMESHRFFEKPSLTKHRRAQYVKHCNSFNKNNNI